MLNKRGQGLSTNAIVLIVLAVIVLVILIAGFTLGWNKLAPWLSNNNVDTVVTSCETACATQSVYDFCTLQRSLKAEGEDEVFGTCKEFAEDYSNYGFSDCPAVDCE